MNKKIKRLIALAGLLCSSTIALAQDSIPDIEYSAGIVMNAGDSQLAPYYIAANRGGTVTQHFSALAHASLWHAMDSAAKRWSWGAGAELWGGYTSSAEYRYVDHGGYYEHKQHPARLWLQEAYAEAKYRSLYAVAGQRHKPSPIVNSRLSSGDLVWSGNARPPVGLLAGFIDFQNIPFTKGWLQLTGEFGYFRQYDDEWLENHYNYDNHFITTGLWLHYKSLHFRSKPDQPLVFTIGAQSACQFGGTAKYYQNGDLQSTVKMDADLKAFWRTFIAGSGGNSKGDSFVEGNHLGTWDVLLEYNFTGGKQLRGYMQSPWEDGSGIGKLNGWDALWGLEYRNGNGRNIVNGALIELVEMTNHSGPIHWAPDDHPGTPVTGEATGADDYYNNYIYNGYQSRGMSIGSPFFKSPLYNRDGYMRYRDNVMRGFHAALMGCLARNLDYRLMGSYRKTWGTPLLPRLASDDFSMMAEAAYHTDSGWTILAQAAMDHGSLYGNNLGALLCISYSGNFNFKKQ